MNKAAFLSLLILFPVFTWAGDAQETLDECISSWGSSAPFKKGHGPDRVITSGVKVFGNGDSVITDDIVTSKPSLILVQPSVNVMGKSNFRLSNPNGWYCFASNVNVMGRMNIEVACNAQIASGRQTTTEVFGQDESGHGVSIFGKLKVSRFDCPDKKVQ